MIKGFIKSILNRKLEITNGFKGNQGKILKKRVLAFTLDLALVIIISSGITFTLTSFVSPYLNLENNKNTLMNFNQYMIIFHVWMTSITLLSYHFISYLLGNGATPGKMLFKLKILPLAVDQTASHERQPLRPRVPDSPLRSGWLLSRSLTHPAAQTRLHARCAC